MTRTSTDTSRPVMHPNAPVAITRSKGPRAAAESIVSGDSLIVRVGDLRLELPPKDQLAFLAGLGILAVFDVIEWPIALAIAVGHEVARSRRGKTLRAFGEALEEA